jgi:hypothetical protein
MWGMGGLIQRRHLVLYAATIVRHFGFRVWLRAWGCKTFLEAIAR